MRRLWSASGSSMGGAPPVLDLAPRVLHGAPRELRHSLVARRLDPERHQRGEQVAPAIELALADLAAQGGSQAALATATPVDPVLHVAHVRGRMVQVHGARLDRREELEEDLFVAQRPGRALDVAQRAPHLVGVEAAEHRAAHLEQRARATERDAEVVHGLVVGRREQARDGLAEPSVEGAELGHEKLAGHAGRRRERRSLGRRCGAHRWHPARGSPSSRA